MKNMVQIIFFLPLNIKSSFLLTQPCIHLLKVNNRNTRKRIEICSKLTIKTPERRHWRHSGVIIVNFEHVIAGWGWQYTGVPNNMLQVILLWMKTWTYNEIERSTLSRQFLMQNILKKVRRQNASNKPFVCINSSVIISSCIKVVAPCTLLITVKKHSFITGFLNKFTQNHFLNVRFSKFPWFFFGRFILLESELYWLSGSQIVNVYWSF